MQNNHKIHLWTEFAILFDADVKAVNSNVDTYPGKNSYDFGGLFILSKYLSSLVWMLRVLWK